MMEKLEGQHGTYIVHYSVLDGDRQGRPPGDPHFDKTHKSCLHKIAKSNNKASTICDCKINLKRQKELGMAIPKGS